ncbi:hypothetical protein GJ744_008036 [Endocarpon pusillum]|uniref:Uncharacterized protein n=1 Tax=Endocarpon pusillum TaxID=364733 RepID=A0A8H7E600_9EURO|nr:hypothetical protein GJ744_008036 [Endocarpon pusillum]
MNPISAATAACLQSFPQLAAALQDPEHCRTMPREKLKGELDRFKIRCGNLGALQTGRSSLDFRLRDSTVVRTNVLKLLDRLQKMLSMSESRSIEGV